MAMNAYDVDSDYPPAAAAEAEQEEDGDKCNGCNLFSCFCRWRKYCRPHVPRVAPGRDVYTRAPSDAAAAAAAAGDHPTWSVLVGCTSAAVPFHNLRLHRFRVAASGRVIGCTDDALEPLLAVSPVDGTTFIDSASVALAPDGLRLYGWYMQDMGFDGAMIRNAADLPPIDAWPQHPHIGFAVDLETNSLLSPPPPPLPFFNGTLGTVWAHGKLWAASVVRDVEGPIVRLVMHRLELGDDTWGEAASVHIPLMNSDQLSCNYLRASYLQGYAVIGDRLILLSVSDSTFFLFDCAGAGALTPVKTTGRKSSYIPICGKGVHLGVGGDGDGDGDGMVVYFLGRASLFAYRLSEDDEGGLFIAPPVEVDRLWPYYEEGNGSVVHLAGRMLCAVWMNMYLPCGCAHRHALITTLLVRAGYDRVEILHSTCRRVDMLRSKAAPRYKSFDTLCFLQEYPDRAAGSQVDVDPSPTMVDEVGEEITDDMPNCCM